MTGTPIIATVTGGTGIDSTGATTGEDIDHTLSINIDGLTNWIKTSPLT